MKKIIFVVLVVAAIVPLNAAAQDAASVIDASAKAMGSATLQSIRYTGSGTNNSVGQAFTAGGPWPRFKITKYVALVNYTVPVMRQESVRVDNENPPRGGGAGGYNPATGQGGHPILDITVADVEPNSSAAREITGNPQRGGAGARGGEGGGPAGIRTEKIADGIWFLNMGAPQSVLVEFKDYLVVIEGGSGDDRTVATIAEAKRMFPAKPIKYLVNTHHHFDHSGGIRAYAAEA